MAGRVIRVGFGSNRTQHRIGPTDSEEYNPISEWKDESTVTILLIHLPGFPKDRTRISFDEHLRLIRLRGRKSLGNNKYVILDKDFNIPENCKEQEMIGKFDNETLTITMPKRLIVQISPEEIPTKNHHEIPNPSHEEPSDKLKVSNIGEENTVAKEEEDDSFMDENDRFEMLESEMDMGKSDEEKTGKLGRFTVPEIQEVQKSFVATDNVVELVRIRLNEERELVVNIGVATVTILALGTCICYKFGLFSVS